MPIVEYKCDRPSCGHVQERIVIAPPDKVPTAFNCERCLVGYSRRKMSTPARVIMGDGKARRKAQRIQEPVWRYPDGHIESLNSKNTRPEEP
jgi:hypothetical protein